jgi:CRISPR-associated endonuclease/helicase Cas3
LNVLLVSQCSKNALGNTRRILDQFAERRGDRTWQTPITQAGLDTLRRLLRKSARKNTAVACHWIRGRDHSELLWIVGDAGRFNANGAVPTNTTSRDILRSDDENDWHTGEDIALLAELAGLLHDLGKSCKAFQQRLLGGVSGRNLYRHEWISLRLFAAFVGDDDDAGWLERLRNPSSKDDTAWLLRLERDGLNGQCQNPFRQLPPLAAAVGWLVVTHHRLPTVPAERNAGADTRWRLPPFQANRFRAVPELLTADWNDFVRDRDRESLEAYWSFPHRLPVTTPKWRKHAAAVATSLQTRRQRGAPDLLDNPYVMHVARLSLMLADHHYSSLEAPHRRERGEPDFPLYANTIRRTGALNQPLDEHLLGVQKHGGQVARSLPGMATHLPRLARHKGFRKRSADARFAWQDKAFDLARALRERSARQGFFGIDMASTGCGKTIANGRILYALADPDRGARFSIALGLRTLTLQTGQAYRERLNLGEDQLAIRVGGSASRALFEHYQREAERSGSASRQRLIEEDGHVSFEGNFDGHAVLRRLKDDPAIKGLVAAPILVCTVDHLVPATEGTRGGRQIAPMLRLMTGDLVLDEIDDFDIDDLPALTRLVHWAGLLGSRVLLSTATLPPALAQGLFDAYRNGRAHYQLNRGEPGRPVEVCCAWFDEHDRQHQDCATEGAFMEAHERFVRRRCQRLADAGVRRRAELVSLERPARERDALFDALAERFLANAQTLHSRHHHVDPHGGKRVSFGLIRMANIDSLFDVALAVYRRGAAEGQRIHLCVYHSQFPALMRSEIEHRLDRSLDRRDADAVFSLPEIRCSLDGSNEPDQLFVVLGSPVTEVGRDHDYDWAIVEPSSMRSIIQLAGRVWRHRERPCIEPNLVILETNVRHLTNPGGPAFRLPGFETAGEWALDSHSLRELMRREELEAIDARPRILERSQLAPRASLVDLEHARLQQQMITPPANDPAPRLNGTGDVASQRLRGRARRQPPAPRLGAYSGHAMPRMHLLGVLPQYQPFRRQNAEDTELVLLPDDEGECWTLHRVHDDPTHRRSVYVEVEQSKLERLDLRAIRGARIQTWGATDYLTSLSALADKLDWDLAATARRFGTVAVPGLDSGWRFHPALGFSRRR